MRIIALEKIILNAPIRYSRIFSSLLLIFLCFAVPSARGGIFGISIPANYGKWFTQIYQIYLDNQDLIANARKLYTAYKRVSNSIDALEGLVGDDKEAFKERWQRNMRVLLETQIWFQVDQSVWGEDQNGINEVLTNLLGLQFDENGNVSMDPSLIGMIGLQAVGDESYWRDHFDTAQVPELPLWLITEEIYEKTLRGVLSNQSGRAWRDMSSLASFWLRTEVSHNISRDPLTYLDCSRRSTCYSPFNFSGDGSGLTYTWEEMLRNMYDRSIPLHNPHPLEGELDFQGAVIRNFDNYLHRRISSAVWLGMGEDLLKKVKRVHASFTKKCNEINGVIYDIQNLVRLIESLLTPLDGWDTTTDSISMIIATSLSITGDGAADEMAKRESFFNGVIKKKLDVALERSASVKTKLSDSNAIFANLIKQIEGVKTTRNKQHAKVQTFGDKVKQLSFSKKPMHNFSGGTAAYRNLSDHIAKALEEKE